METKGLVTEGRDGVFGNGNVPASFWIDRRVLGQKAVKVFQEGEDARDVRQEVAFKKISHECVTSSRAWLGRDARVHFPIMIMRKLRLGRAKSLEESEERAGNSESFQGMVVQEPVEEPVLNISKGIHIISSSKTLDPKENTTVEAEDVGVIVGVGPLEFKIVTKGNVHSMYYVVHHVAGRAVV